MRAAPKLWFVLLAACSDAAKPAPSLAAAEPSIPTDAPLVVFLGDSRTLCGIHPEFIDPLLDRRSINLAASAHWIPAQYPFVRDLVEELRPGTAVVLSVGPINFIQLGEGALGTTYPIPLDELGLYLSLGFSLQQLRPNLIEHSVLGSPVRPLLAATAQVRQVFDGFGQRALYPPATEPPPDPYLAQAERLGAQLRADPEHVFVGPVYGDGHVTSLEVYGARGGYQRIELDRAFFRARQVAPLEERPFVLSEARLALFERILALCRERGVHLIVNEICEAPHTYVGEREQRELAFMRDVVRPLVASYGFPCTRPDYTQLDDADYLDYNHFNQDGVQRYAPLLAEVLRPHLPPRKD